MRSPTPNASIALGSGIEGSMRLPGPCSQYPLALPFGTACAAGATKKANAQRAGSSCFTVLLRSGEKVGNQSSLFARAGLPEERNRPQTRRRIACPSRRWRRRGALHDENSEGRASPCSSMARKVAASQNATNSWTAYQCPLLERAARSAVSVKRGLRILLRCNGEAIQLRTRASAEPDS